MSLLDDEDEVILRTDNHLERKKELDNAWQNFCQYRLDRFCKKGLSQCNFLPKTGVVIPDDFKSFERIYKYCEDNKVGLVYIDCHHIHTYEDVVKAYSKIEPGEIIWIENISALVDNDAQTAINYLIHAWKNPVIERKGQPDIITDQQLVIFTIWEDGLDKANQIWQPSDSFAWYGDIMKK